MAHLLEDYGCLHFKFSILLGISEPAYDPEQLAAFKAADKETFEFEGQKYTKYEASQVQRKLETAIRHQKDRANTAKAAGNDDMRRQAQEKINHLASKYKKFSDASGLPTRAQRMSVSGFHKVKTKAQLTNKTKSGIIDRGIVSRNMANSMRKSPLHLLTDEEIDSILHDADELGIDRSILLFNSGRRTGFRDYDSRISVRGDILPDPSSKIPRDCMSQRAVLAHEYYGHYCNHPSEYPFDSWEDEFRASYDAAIKAPNLSDEDRRYLMLDAYDRAKEAGVTVEYSNEARRIIYGF